jgi:hypothetical protein
LEEAVMLGRTFGVLALAGALGVGVVGAKPAAAASAKKAKSAADGVITAYMTTPGSPGVCDVRTESGFFNKKRSYLASCASNAGDLHIFVITNASKGSFSIKSSLLDTKVGEICGADNGFAYSVGVKGKLVEIFAENATPDEPEPGGIARGLRDLLAQQLANTPGRAEATLCEH